MKVAIYARVSRGQGQDPEMQLRELREFCQRRGWAAAKEYVNAGVCGAGSIVRNSTGLWPIAGGVKLMPS
jgi:DNA invertase Pin-like site-specific DNA recombinase